MALTCKPAVGASTTVWAPAETDIGPEQPPPVTAIPAPPSTENENVFPDIPFAAALQISRVPGAETRGFAAAFATVAGTTKNPLNNNVMSELKSQNIDFRPCTPYCTMPPDKAHRSPRRNARRTPKRTCSTRPGRQPSRVPPR